MICHPLVSPVTTSDWTGAPPLWLASGSGERFQDCQKLVATTAAQSGVIVRWDCFELMPHNFCTVFKNWPQTKCCLKKMAQACDDFVSGLAGSTKGTLIKWDGLNEESQDVFTLATLSRDEAESIMRTRQAGMITYTGEPVVKAKI